MAKKVIHHEWVDVFIFPVGNRGILKFPVSHVQFLGIKHSESLAKLLGPHDQLTLGQPAIRVCPGRWTKDWPRFWEKAHHSNSSKWRFRRFSLWDLLLKPTRKHPKRVKPTCKWQGVFVTHSLDMVSYSSEVENLDVIYISSYLQMSQIPIITLNPLLKGKRKSRPVQQTNELWFSCRFESLLQPDDTIQKNPANRDILWQWNFIHHTDRPLRFANAMFEEKAHPGNLTQISKMMVDVTAMFASLLRWFGKCISF